MFGVSSEFTLLIISTATGGAELQRRTVWQPELTVS